MEDIALLRVADCKNALHAVEVLALCLEQLADPLLRQIHVELAFRHLLQLRAARSIQAVFPVAGRT